MAKIGRNAPCPCGSGRKYKRCHGSPRVGDDVQRAVAAAAPLVAAREARRERQQGLGRPIIAAQTQDGRRYVAVKNRLMHSKKWRTFHDFLFDYIKTALGADWGNAEIARPVPERHPVMVWYEHLCKLQAEQIKEPGKVHSAPMTGAAAAYLHLAYDLYALDHNAELQDRMLARLRNKDSFASARYEVFVAATLIRAGFELEFENEDDRSTTHCEFTATCKRTGRKFSVEAKHRAGSRFKFGRQLIRALKKQAKYTRIVFIDVNLPDDQNLEWRLDGVRAALRHFEGKIIEGQPLPIAYTFVTNTPWQHHLTGPHPRAVLQPDGFQMPDFKPDARMPLREAIDARERHTEMFQLMQSIQDHSDVPSTFDGEIPEFAFSGENNPRLLIGQRYLIKDKEGNEHAGTLTSAAVMEKERVAMCALSFEDGSSSGLYSWPLSDTEMAAWRRYPDTFFGEVGQRKKRADNPLDLYDFFFESYSKTPRERLLELMANAINIEQLRKLDQPNLASIYAERMVYGALASMERKTSHQSTSETGSPLEPPTDE